MGTGHTGDKHFIFNTVFIKIIYLNNAKSKFLVRNYYEPISPDCLSAAMEIIDDYVSWLTVTYCILIFALANSITLLTLHVHGTFYNLYADSLNNIRP